MATVIESDYESFRTASFTGVYYMDPADGRTDTFDIFGITAGGAVFRCSEATRPETFDGDYPSATKVNMMTLT